MSKLDEARKECAGKEQHSPVAPRDQEGYEHTERNEHQNVAEELNDEKVDELEYSTRVQRGEDSVDEAGDESGSGHLGAERDDQDKRRVHGEHDHDHAPPKLGSQGPSSIVMPHPHRRNQTMRQHKEGAASVPHSRPGVSCGLLISGLHSPSTFLRTHALIYLDALIVWQGARLAFSRRYQCTNYN